MAFTLPNPHPPRDLAKKVRDWVALLGAKMTTSCVAADKVMGDYVRNTKK